MTRQGEIQADRANAFREVLEEMKLGCRGSHRRGLADKIERALAADDAHRAMIRRLDEDCSVTQPASAT